jgi:hypothetical protein
LWQDPFLSSFSSIVLLALLSLEAPFSHSKPNTHRLMATIQQTASLFSRDLSGATASQTHVWLSTTLLGVLCFEASCVAMVRIALSGPTAGLQLLLPHCCMNLVVWFLYA